MDRLPSAYDAMQRAACNSAGFIVRFAKPVLGPSLLLCAPLVMCSVPGAPYPGFVVRAQNIAIANFRRAAPDGAQPWPTTVDIWYSERVVDMDDNVPKWCALCAKAFDDCAAVCPVVSSTA